jgi:hypothetical protein
MWAHSLATISAYLSMFIGHNLANPPVAFCQDAQDAQGFQVFALLHWDLAMCLIDHVLPGWPNGALESRVDRMET